MHNERFLCPKSDNTLSLDQHISTLSKKVSNQLTAMGWIQKYIGFKEKEMLLNSFFLSNFNYCSLVWHFCSSKSLEKIQKCKSKYLEYYVTTPLVIIINF